MEVARNSTDVTTYFDMGAANTGFTPANVDLTYTRYVSVPIKADATAGTVAGAHADNTIIEVDATNAEGLARVDWPDAAFVAGAREVILTVKISSTVLESLRVDLHGRPTKGVAFEGVRIPLLLASNNISPATGVTPTLTVDLGSGYSAKDAGTTVTEEVPTGVFVVNLAAPDTLTSSNMVSLKLSEATADDSYISIYFEGE